LAFRCIKSWRWRELNPLIPLWWEPAQRVKNVPELRKHMAVVSRL